MNTSNDTDNNLNKSIKTSVSLYEKLHKNAIPNFKKAEFFLSKIKFLFCKKVQEIIFSSSSVRVLANYKNKNFIIDYDYGFEDSIFVAEKTKTKYTIKQCIMDFIEKTIKSFFEITESQKLKLN